MFILSIDPGTKNIGIAYIEYTISYNEYLINNITPLSIIEKIHTRLPLIKNSFNNFDKLIYQYTNLFLSLKNKFKVVDIVVIEKQPEISNLRYTPTIIGTIINILYPGVIIMLIDGKEKLITSSNKKELDIKIRLQNMFGNIDSGNDHINDAIYNSYLAWCKIINKY